MGLYNDTVNMNFATVEVFMLNGKCVEDGSSPEMNLPCSSDMPVVQSYPLEGPETGPSENKLWSDFASRIAEGLCTGDVRTNK